MHAYRSRIRTLDARGIGRLAAMLLATALLVAGQRAHAAELHGRVVGISDGDTLTVLDAARVTHRIRLNGIDAPEKGQPWGARARERLSALVFGKPVVVIWNKHDRYRRVVGSVHVAAAGACAAPACPQSHDVGLALIESGLAWHYKRYQNEQSAEDRTRYARAEDTARSRRVGLWQDANPVAPWDYRGQQRTDAARMLPAVRVN